MVIRKQFAFDADTVSHETGLSNELQNLLWSSLMLSDARLARDSSQMILPIKMSEGFLTFLP